MASNTPITDDTHGWVRVRGAREHNLRHVDVDIPRNTVVAFSGISGSGKSSLAFGTLYAEAQRRYFDSVAPYARRLIQQVAAPQIDSISGLPPAVALQQQRGTPSVRSSVGSVTTIAGLLRMLYSRAGTYPPRQPMLYAEDFSPNTPQGACAACHGLGHVFSVPATGLVPDPSKTIREGAVAAWPSGWHGQNLRDILTTLGHDIDVPWRDLPRKTRDWILLTDEQPSVPVWAGFTLAEVRQARRQKEEPSYQGTFTGARAYVQHTFATTQSELMKRRVSRFMQAKPCPQCHGKRLKKAALSVTFAGLDIGEMTALSLRDLADRLREIAAGRMDDPAAGRASQVSRSRTRQDRAERAAEGHAAHAKAFDASRTPVLSEEKRIAAQRLARDIVDRIDALQRLGLGYLGLDRATPTLSPGELQRLRLATQMKANLFGVIYVLDEPSAGLHPADSEALLEALQELKRSGNTVFVVEHDLDTLRRADWLVDVGPGAGTEGGQILYSGPPAGLRDVADSHTAAHLFRDGPLRGQSRRKPHAWLELRHISRNNLRALDARIPLGVFTTVTGVSGSGKSSLVSQAMVELLGDHLGQEAPADVADAAPAAEFEAVSATGTLGGATDRVKRLVMVDQRPIGRTPRSNLATYTGLLDPVRRLFAATPEARRRRFDAGRFSFNVGKGRCKTCEGEGFVSVEMMFLPSVFAPCPTCHGDRYDPATLRVTWRGSNIAEVLRMTVTQALAFFEGEDAITRALATLQQIGLGYLRLGQPATELSGGEAQRIKLATELQRPEREGTVYVLDEPTTGLHPADVGLLLARLHRLVDTGHTVVVVEHDLDVIASSDWIIDMGPGAGAEGGRIAAQGHPQDVAASPDSVTGRYLRQRISS